MTTGDEPMLPQPADDNSPMISGRGTKIIADMRGAYLAGNLAALIQHMDETQQSRFKTAMLKQPIVYAEWWARHLPLDILARLLNAASLRLLDHPSDQNRADVEQLIQRVRSVDNRILDEAEEYELLGANVTAEFAADFCLAMDEMPDMPLEHKADYLIIIPTNYLAYADIWTNFGKTTRAWQIEAAWAILQVHETPPFEVNS